MALSELAVRRAKPAEKSFRLFDGNGLYLEVTPAGGKLWRFKFRHDGKEKKLALGAYPDVTLAVAREKVSDARRELYSGVDPAAQKQRDKQLKKIAAANSFEAVTREWLDGRKSHVEEAQHLKTLARMENDVFPWLGKRPIGEIDAPEILAVLRRIDGRGARYSAHRVRSEVSRVFRYAIATGRAKSDPAQSLIGAIPPAVENHFASIVEPARVGEMLRAFEAFSGTFTVQCALKLAPMLFVRPGELRQAEWLAFDLDKAEWRYAVSKTKTDHLVPLSTQAVTILRQLHALNGAGRYVFPSARGATRPMSDAAVNAALRRLGYDTRTEITGHGFRAMARTILHEELFQKPEVIEHQLAHAVPDTLGTAYNRTKFLKERRAMMQIWADCLDKLRTGAEVVSINSKTAA